MKFFFIFTLLLLWNTHFSLADKLEKLDGHWFECEFTSKTEPPKDKCKMLDDDGFKFEKSYLIHIKNVSSKETNCKKKKVGQCFKADQKSILITYGRKDKIAFENSNLILSFLGCNQYYKLVNKKNYVRAVPNKKRCFWAGKKNFFIKKYSGKINIK